MFANPSILMKKPIIVLACFLIAISSSAQVGIGTTSPNTTLDVRGSLAVNTRSFSTTSETVSATDYALLFTGTSACTVTLPTAIGCTGRIIHLKNTKTSSVPILTVSTTSSQTIDGSGTTWLLDDPNESVNLVSDGANWKIMGQSLPTGSGTSWTQGGNTVVAEKKLGTTDNFALPFITNGTERMRISNTGSVGIGASSFDTDNPEALLVDAGSPAVSTDFQNVIIARANTNNYAQFNITNANSGGKASTDIVATANNGSETEGYIDLGINSSNYSNGASGILNGANRAYLYATGQDFYIGNGSGGKDLVFFTNATVGTAGPNGTERMRLTSAGLLPGGNGVHTLGTSSNRWSVVYAVNGTVQTSDARLKTNIATLRYGLREVMEMHPVSYNWKENPLSDNKIGLLAQDVRKIVPEIVVGDEATENIGMNYAELVPVLINAIKEQQQQIEDLKKKVKRLENK